MRNLATERSDSDSGFVQQSISPFCSQRSVAMVTFEPVIILWRGLSNTNDRHYACRVIQETVCCVWRYNYYMNSLAAPFVS